MPEQDDKFKKTTPGLAELFGDKLPELLSVAPQAIEEGRAANLRELQQEPETPWQQRMVKRYEDPGFLQGWGEGMFGRERAGWGIFKTAIPFVSTAYDIAHLADIIGAFEAAETGTATAEQRKRLEDFQDWQFQQQYAGAGYMAGHIAGETTGFVGEFVTGGKVWTELTKYGVKKGALKGFAKYLSKGA